MSGQGTGARDEADPTGIQGLADLGAAAVAMLEPLLDAERRDGVFRRLADAVRMLGTVGDTHGLRSLNYLAALLVPMLRARAQGQPADDDIERAERWVGDAIAFCGGQLPGDDALRLVGQLDEWPGNTPLQPRFAQLIEARLRDDGRRLAEWAALADATPAEGAGGIDAASVDAVADRALPNDAAPADALSIIGAPVDARTVDTRSVDPAPADTASSDTASSDTASSDTASADTESNEDRPEEPATAASAEPIVVARDELALLREAAEVLGEDIDAAFPAATGVADPASWRDGLDEVHEGLTRIAAAAEPMGLVPLARLMARWCARISGPLAQAPMGDVPAVDWLRRLAPALEAWCRGPDAATAAALVSLAGAGQAQGRTDARLALGLSNIRLVDSRRVTLDRTLADRSDEERADALSMAIPAQDDPGMIDALRREVSSLASRFTDCVAQLDPSGGGFDEARRIAHTLKGAAQTAGVRAIALLTHRLEDLLQLAAADDDAGRQALLPVLVEAADCLEEMAERLGRDASAPGGTAALLQAIESRIRQAIEGRSVAPPASWSRAVDAPVGQDGGPAPSMDAGREPLRDPQRSWAAGGDMPDVLDPPGALDDRAEPAIERVADDWVRVPADRYEALLARSREAMIALARLRAQVARMAETRETLRDGGERIQDLAGDLARQVDLRGLQLARPAGDGDARDPAALQAFDDLHEVSRRIAEAALDAREAEQQLERQLAGLRALAGQLERLQGETRETLLAARRVPVASIVPRLRRIVRQAARLADREVELQISGDTMPVDDALLQDLLDPLGHLLRNAVDHGVGDPARRRAAGKPATGRIDVVFEADRGRLKVTVRDDGLGLDRDAVLRRARALGWWSASDPPDDAELVSWVLTAGFSVRERAGALSGRGVGLDVVARAVTARGGRLTIDPGIGRGLRATLALPMGPTALPVMVLRSDTHVLALSTRGLRRIESPSQDPADAGSLPTLAALLGLPEPALPLTVESERWLRVAGDGEQWLRAPVPAAATEVMVDPLPSMLPPVPGVVGTTVLPDGAVATVIDLPELLARRQAPPAGDLAAPVDAAPGCLVVDDSPSVRRAMLSFARDLGLRAEAAADGREALEHIARHRPDIVLVDMEMPRMDGIAFVEALRAAERAEGARRLPVVMITSRSAERHRRRAIEAGVDAFLGKPAGEDELAGTIRRLLGGVRAG